VVEFRDRCQKVEQHLQKEESELANRERKLLDAHSDSLESSLFRLEEQQQRSIGLAEGNSLLTQQLSQSEQTNLALRVDLQKLTADWTRAMEEAELREVNWQKEKESLERERERWLEERRVEEAESRAEEERRREMERSYQSLSQAVVTLSRVLGSSPPSMDHVSSLLEVLSQADSALQRRHQEQQEVGVLRRRWVEQQESLQGRLFQLEADNTETNTLLQHTQLELAHTQQILARVEEALMENTQLKEREMRSHMELHSLKGAVEREQLDRQRAEEEAVDAREALHK
ncbi:hypothetical protein NHX12_006805, partial [Muraenolepis orangiensis]